MPEVLASLADLLRKVRAKHLLFMQIVFALLAFAAMVMSSYFYMSGTVRGYLKGNADSMLTFVQSKLESDLREPESTLDNFSQMMRFLLLRGDDKAVLHNLINVFANHLRNDNQKMSSFSNVYGYFKTQSGEVFLGSNAWKPPSDYVDLLMAERPWYKAAVEARGAIAQTEPYRDMSTGKTVLTFSRCVFDDNDEMLAIVCVNVLVETLGKDIVKTAANLRGYGMLLNSDLDVLVHPDQNYVGLNISDKNFPIHIFANVLKRGEEISEQPIISFKNEPSVVFFRKLNNGWFAGLVVPTASYYKSVVDMAWSLGTLGLIFSAAVIYFLVAIDAAKDKAHAVSEHKSAFLANMSHEIRTPMNAILGITEIQLSNKLVPPDTLEGLGKIYNSANILMGIINDILDLSKIESGKLELLPNRYDVASVINDTIQLNMMRFESKPIVFKLVVSEKIPSMLVGDELRIKQIMSNLLSNAAKYTNKGEVELVIKTEYGTSDSNSTFLVFHVRDTGIGMTPEQIERLFDEYARFNHEANRYTEGTGLGMTITRKLVQMMNGEILVESEPDKGTLVTVRLPQGVIGEVVLGSEVVKNLQRFRMVDAWQKKKAPIMRDYMPYGRVLVVDDVQTNLYVAKGLMVPYGLHIDTATRGADAIEMIKQGNVYDVIFMDHMMPEMDGIEAVKHIRKLGYRQPIIALTANAMVGQAEMFMENGFDGFLSKPIDIRQLNASLNNLIRDKQTQEVIEAAHRQHITDKNTSKLSNTQIDIQLAKSAVRDTEKAVDILGDVLGRLDSCGDEDFDAFVAQTHALNGVMANIDENRLSKTAARLEAAGKNRDITVISRDTPAFLEKLKAVIKKITPEEEEEEEVSGVNAGEDIAHLREKLSAILLACNAYDIITADSILVEVKQQNWPQQTVKILDSVTDHLLHSEFDEAAELVTEYLDNDMIIGK